ncbi:MAG: energy-coupling factor transporter transmembrane protein EcfT [Deltaproteobacteria bacterium]|nr:energy-coupling factor transporter transmembrane protein EcfT [Deltaproteobacteria bacterium]
MTAKDLFKMGHYIAADSPVHGLDPRVKIGAVILLSIMILRGSALSLSMITLCLLAIILLSNLSFRRVVRAMRPILFFLALLFGVHLFFTPGRALPPFPIWHVTITEEGLFKGLLVSWQFALLLLNGSLLTMTTPPSELVCGIERALRPLKIFKIPSHDIALMISVALRFVPTILDEVERMKEAQMARGACFNGGTLLERARANLVLLVPLMIRTLHRADNLVTAMESRGYERGRRTYLRELRLRSQDYTAIALMAIGGGIFLLRGTIFPPGF